MTIDQTLFNTINGLTGRYVWLDATAQLFLNDYFVPTLMAIILLALWFEGDDQIAQAVNQQAVWVATLSTILANIIVKLVNLLYFRPRPFADQTVNLLFYRPTDSSLPSNAAAIGFAIAAGVWLHNRAWGWVLLIIALLFGLSRIIGGVHYPLDVLVGAGLGCFSAWLVRRQRWLLDPWIKFTVTLAHKLSLS